MKKALFLAPFAAALFACGGQEPSQVSGLIVDATMNTVSVAVQGGDTLSFSTLEAERIGPDGMLLGDTATVFFQGEAKPGEIIPAARLEVRPRPRLERIITGVWVQPIPGMDGVQGMELKGDGSASSVNMSTLLYRTWMLRGDKLILTGESVGNGQTIDFTDTLSVERFSADTLVLEHRGMPQVYSRQK